MDFHKKQRYEPISIPVTVETGPQVYMALAWVVIGILTSIIFWEIIKYAAYAKPNEDQRKAEFQKNKQGKRIKELDNHEIKCKHLLKIFVSDNSQLSKREKVDLTNQCNRLNLDISKLRGKIKGEELGLVDDIAKAHERFIKQCKKYIRRLKKIYKDTKHKESVDHERELLKDEQELLHEERSFNKKLYDYMDNRLSRKTIPHTAIIDGGTIGFGIAIGFLALLSQGYVTGIRVITPIHILALIGLGLAIGSLREYVYKASQPS